jgi:hypothetical protein
MAEHDEREEASRRYRGLPREEPPPALDAAIRAHARRAVEVHPAPLVTPTGRRQWYFPLAAAAVIVLAVAVTWHVEREQPDMVAVAPQSAPAPVAAAQRPEPPVGIKDEAVEQRKLRSAAPAKRQVEKPQDERARDNAALAKESEAKARSDPSPQPELAAKSAPSAPAKPAPSAPAVAAAPAAPAASRADEAGARAQPRLGAAARSEMARLYAETPEQWLERIVRLRAEGKHEEADRALAEFRKRHPDFRISPEMLEKVEKR